MKQILSLCFVLFLFFVCVTTAFALPEHNSRPKRSAEVGFWKAETLHFD